MKNGTSMSPLDEVVLYRLVTARESMDASRLAHELRRYRGDTKTEVEWREELDGVVSALSERGIVTAAGALVERDRTARDLGASSARWRQVMEHRLPLRALGADDVLARDLAKRGAWTAAIAGRLLGIWEGGRPPSIATLGDAYVWRQLGLPGRPKRCPAELRALFMQREIATPPAPLERQLRLYAARELGAARAEVNALRDALVRRWIAGAARPDVPGGFARDVRDVAVTMRSGVFGGRKVFISALWGELRRRAPWSALALDVFKQRLLAEHRAGTLVLARADLVAAMPADLVRESETQADGAAFHFVVREQAQ